LEDLEEGVFIQQTVESVLQNEDGKQLLVSCIVCLFLPLTLLTFALQNCNLNNRRRRSIWPV